MGREPMAGFVKGKLIRKEVYGMVYGFRRRYAGILALLTAAMLLVAACGGGGQGGPGSDQGGAGAEPKGAGGADAGDAPSTQEFKLAMILPGTVEDADYNFVGYEALQALHQEFGLETSYQERVAPADAERVARGFINDGYNLIAFHGGQFVTTVQKLAPEFPDVNFIAESSGEIAGLPENVWNIGRKFYEGFYALGALAAHAT
ncbi:MAG TPA: BMP family ABC transporter substrate-binding protein, partial [Bacillota bacterium]